MTVIEWCVLGILMLAAMLFSARIMRRGLTTLEEDRSQYAARLAAEERQLDEDRKHISAEEHLYTTRAALEDFLRLENCSGQVELRGNVLEITGNGKTWQIELVMRERLLASTQKVLHGRSRWLLRGPNINESHTDIASLMSSLNAYWHAITPDNPEPAHLARRVAASRRTSPGGKREIAPNMHVDSETEG